MQRSCNEERKRDADDGERDGGNATCSHHMDEAKREKGKNEAADEDEEAEEMIVAINLRTNRKISFVLSACS